MRNAVEYHSINVQTMMIEKGHDTVLLDLVVVFSIYSVNTEHYCTINEQCVNLNFFFFIINANVFLRYLKIRTELACVISA